MKKPDGIKHILEVIVNIAESFLERESGIPVEKNASYVLCSSRFDFKPVTALMSISGCFRMTITFSFDKALITKIFEVYSQGLSFEDNDLALHIEETAADMINIVIGNATAKLAEGGTTVQISAPIVIHEANAKPLESVALLTATLFTHFGEMMITAIPVGSSK
ncbi:MAG: CheY-specific phosphatase CheX [Alteromonadaceae bacterium]|jgi:CheY-specific phosphatase CheX